VQVLATPILGITLALILPGQRARIDTTLNIVIEELS
jgi:hypothetical protein